MRKRIAALEKENADLRRQLEDRQKKYIYTQDFSDVIARGILKADRIRAQIAEEFELRLK